MVPLVMSTPREDNTNIGFEEFATHLSLYDDTFHFTEKSVPTIADIKGPLPPSVFCPISKNTDDVTVQVKVKRKCGRPRNPIPRHKRESHINAEHRRRGKIQDGFRTLKNIVPKYEQTSGRDSKADILFKAVDYCKLLQNDMQEMRSSMEALRAERDLLTLDIKNYKTLVPDVCIYDDQTVSIDDRYDEYVQQKTKECWTFGTFKAIMQPLFQSYKLSVRGDNMEEFLCSVADWSSNSLSFSSLTTVCLAALRNTPKQEITASTPYRDDMLNIRNMRSTSYENHPLTSDTNNNSQCLGTQSFTSQHYKSHDDDVSGSSSNGIVNVPMDVYANTFDSNCLMSNKTSAIIKGETHMKMKQLQDVGRAYSGSHANNSFLSDLYYNMDYNQHHQLNLARASIDGSDHWSHLYLQQHWHCYQNQFSPNHFQDLKKTNHFWYNQQITENLAAELTSRSNSYYEQSHSLSDRNFRYDLTSAKEIQDAQSAQGPYIGYTTNFLEHRHGRHKSQSQSSSESEGSMLNMETFAKQASEMLVEQDKYSQLSPSTDSCISPGSSMFVPSPCVLSGRNIDHISSHSGTFLDQHQQQKCTPHDRVESQESISLPSYRDTFGNRSCQQNRQSVTRCHGTVRPQWAVNTLTDTPASRRKSLERLEPPTLLAEILNQQSTLPQTRSFPQCVDMTWSSAQTPSTCTTPSNTILTKTSITDMSSCHVKNGPEDPVKLNNGYSLPSFTTQQITMNRCPSGQDLPSSSSPVNREQRLGVNMSTASHTQLPTAHAGWEVTNLGVSSWLSHKPQSSPDLDVSQKTKPNDNDNRNISYFEMAHEQLLKYYSLSLNNHKINQISSSDVTMSARPASIHSTGLETQDDTYKNAPVCTIVTPLSPVVKDIRFSLAQSNSHRLPIQISQVSVDSLLKLNVRRKCSFDDNYTDDQMLQPTNGCKRTRIWQDHEQRSNEKLNAGSLQVIHGTADRFVGMDNIQLL